MIEQREIENWAGGEEINSTLREHEENIEEWKYRPLAQELYRWAAIFQFEFKLQNPQPVIVFDRTRSSTLATYMRGRSGFGTRYTITINNRYLNDPFYRILRRLLHEMIHQWQELHGKIASRSSYHNKQFIGKALACGLLTDHGGYDLGHTEVFSKLLEKHGMNVPEIEGEPSDERLHGTSKLKKWHCGCTNVWCAVALHAQCLECGSDFEKEVKRR